MCVGDARSDAVAREIQGQRLEVVGVAADEKAVAADEVRAYLDAWLTERFPKLNFRIGLDCTGEMKKLWMEASFSFGIPSSFVVDRDSCIAFIGHPAELGDVLPKVLDGSWRTSDQAKSADRSESPQGEKTCSYTRSWGR
nr:hypothetical protein [Sinorhizobium medicae]